MTGGVDLTGVLTELIDGFILQRERRALLMPELYAPPTLPRPGASESDLEAAEGRLGRRLDPVHRQLLQVANGWPEFDGSRNLLGTADIGVSTAWGAAQEMIDIYAETGGGAMFGWPADRADAVPICEYSHSTAFVIMSDGPDHAAGQVRDFSSGSNSVFHTVETWLRCELENETDWLDGESYGPHGRAWRRPVTPESPGIPEIVAKLGESRRAFRAIRPIWLPEPGPDANPGATADRIDALTRELSLPAEHRLLLSSTDGWPSIAPVAHSVTGFGAVDLLSVAELRDGTRWRAAVDRAYAAAQRLEIGTGEPVPVYPDLTPLAVSTEAGLRAWAIGTDEAGRVIQWPAYLMTEQFSSIRDYLLHLVDEAERLLDMARIDALDTEHVPR
ncbi:SMI1/KNR4 family protein [Nocardia sp. NPDC059240]|uniref:SMI1/KNR4 family protein n=1 Tax=Nocardia sp. NPDC059240 TaxID=3346786 RepID=UPI003687173C